MGLKKKNKKAKKNKKRQFCHFLFSDINPYCNIEKIKIFLINIMER